MARRLVRTAGEYLQRPGVIVAGYPFSFFCWANLIEGGGNLFSFGNTGADTDWIRGTFNATTGSASFAVTTPAEGFVTFSATVPGGYAPGAWIPMLYVAGSSTDRRIYARGAPLASSTTLANWPTLNVTTLGCLQRTTRIEHMEGAIAHATFWSAALTDAEAMALASGSSPRNVRAASVVEYWPLRGLATDSPERGHVRRLDLSTIGTSWAADPLPALHSPYTWTAAIPAAPVDPEEPDPEPGTGSGGAIRRRRVAAMIARARAGF